MSEVLPYVRFVRALDLRTWDLRERVVINPRTRNAETRAGITWQGTREYHTPEGVLRVLRRREQVESPGHLATLRRLGTADGHPSGDRDLDPASLDLCCGWTGDDISIEMVGGWARPVAGITVNKPAVFAHMMPSEQWAEYARSYPMLAAGIQRGTAAANTGTSAGYGALWVTPHNEAEIVEDNEDGLVGEWLGPDGEKYLYDIEHIIDPACDFVARLVRDDDFDPSTLGGQHFAINLASMAGRGGKQSELIQVVDSMPVGKDPTRGRVQFATPRASTIGTPPVPALAPEPAEDSREAPEQENTGTKEMTTTKKAFDIGIPKNAREIMASRGIGIPNSVVGTLDMAEADILLPAIEGLMAALSEVAAALSASEGEKESMDGELNELKASAEDMPAVEKLQAREEELKAELEKLGEEMAAAKAASADAAKTSDAALTTANDRVEALTQELAPVRAQQFADFRAQAVVYDLPEAKATQCNDALALKRAFVVHTFDGVGDYSESSPELISQLFAGAWQAHVSKHAKQVADAVGKTTPPVVKPAPNPFTGFGGVPALKLAHDEADEDKTPPKPKAQSRGAALVSSLG